MVLTRYLDGMNQALQYLSNAGNEGAKRDSIYEYLKDVLPANKTEEQQLRYVGRQLEYLLLVDYQYHTL